MDIHELIVKKFEITDNDSFPLKAKIGTREELAALFGELGFKIGAEIGVRTGNYSLRLCRNIKGLKIKCVDPWKGFRRNSQRRMDVYLEAARTKLAPYDVEIIRKTSIEASNDVPDGSLDFVYIDAMHEFDSVMVDIILWAPKVRSGGIVSGHDYTEPNWCNGVIPAVEAYTKIHDIRRWYITSGSNRGEYGVPSFFWVRS